MPVPGLDLSPTTELQLAPGLRARLDAKGHVLVDAPDGTIIDIGPRGFAMLSYFSRPHEFGDAVAHLEAVDTTDFAPTMNVVNMLSGRSASGVNGAPPEALTPPRAGRPRRPGVAGSSLMTWASGHQCQRLIGSSAPTERTAIA